MSALAWHRRWRSTLRVSIDPGDPERLHLQSRLSATGRLIGALLAAAAAGIWADTYDRGPEANRYVAALAGAAGAAILFGRRRLVFDRRAGLVISCPGAPWTFRRTVVARAPFERLKIAEEVRTGTDSESGDTWIATDVHLVLETAHGPLTLARADYWEPIADAAEALAYFLEIPTTDLVRGEARDHRLIDLSLAEAVWRRMRTLGRAAAPRNTVAAYDQRQGGTLRVEIPRPTRVALAPYLGIALFVFVLWTIPVALCASLWFGLLPLAIALGTAVKVGFGYSATIDVSPRRLRVEARGLVLRRTVEIPAAELEDLLVKEPEWGGWRDALAHTLAGVLIARSDQTSVRFGHGLSREELESLRARILTVMTERVPARFRPGNDPGPVRSPRTRTFAPDLPVFGMWIGMLVGGLIGTAAGGWAGVGVAVPFLEHVLNVGGLMGAIVMALPNRPRPALAGAAAIGLLLLLEPSTDWLHRAPEFDEERLMRGRHPQGGDAVDRPWVFWIGWIATYAGIATVGLWLFLRVVWVPFSSAMARLRRLAK